MKLTPAEYKKAVDRLKTETPIQYKSSYFRNWDKKVRNLFDYKIRDLLKELYSGYLNEDDKVINLPNEDSEYSMLNYLNTHYTAFSIIVNYFNRKIVEAGKNGKLISTHQLNFEPDRSNWYTEMQNLIKILVAYKYDILLQNDNGVFDAIIKAIEKTNKSGYLSEKEMASFIKTLIPVAKNFEFGGHGKKSDMIGGIDIKFTVGNKINTLQQKRCSSVHKGKFYYFVGGVGGIKPYDVTYLGFQTSDNELFIFKNDESIKIKEYEAQSEKYANDGKKYQIPVKNFVASKKLKK